MREKESAYFVEYPRRADELSMPHPLEQEHVFEIVKTVTLSEMDYENFITDMVADRQFLTDSAALCSQGEVWRCLLVRQGDARDGVLVLPEADGHVKYAARWTPQGEETKGSKQLTKDELEILSILWRAEAPLPRTEILARAGKQDGYALLNDMQEKGLLTEAGVTRTEKSWARLYAPAFSAEEYAAKER